MSVSVVMPVYNSAGSVDAAIASVLAQTYTDFELIICDDGSSDGSLELCRDYAGEDSRVRVLALSHKGVSAARNAGLDQAEGEYVAFMDSDDVAYPVWLATMLDGMQDADLAAVGYDVLDPGGGFLHGTRVLEEGWRRLPREDFLRALFSNELMYQGYVWNKLFKRSIIEQGAATCDGAIAGGHVFKRDSIDRGAASLRFHEDIAYNEDRLFVFEYLQRTANVAFSPAACYTYYQQSSDGIYRAAKATEIDALERMLDCLEQGNNADPVFFARKDMFRAAVSLYSEADRASHTDVERFLDTISSLSSFQDEFAAYPVEFQRQIQSAISHAESRMTRGRFSCQA